MKDLRVEFPKIADFIMGNHKGKVYRYTWISGSQTIVYPISLCNRTMDIQLSCTCRKKSADKLGRDLIKEFGDIFDDFLFDKGDGSCPKTLTVFLKEEYCR